MRITEREIIKYKLRTGDILFSHRNTEKGLGATAMFDSGKTVIHTAKYLRIRPLEIYDSRFLMLLLEIYRQSGHLVQLAGKYTGMMAINVTALKQMKVPLISIGHQTEILTESGYLTF